MEQDNKTDNKTNIRKGQSNIEDRKLLVGKIILSILFPALLLSLFSLTHAWFSEITTANTNLVNISAQYVTKIYITDFERDQLDIDNMFIGQTGLGIEGTETEEDMPYRARFLISIAVDYDTPIPIQIIYNIESVSVEKHNGEKEILTTQQIESNFKVYTLNTITQEPDNICSRVKDFILVIQYWGEEEGIPFLFSGIEYNGAKFTFTINARGRIE